eukprot:GHVP01004624.1.p1 GENE.GHVP01004624.1~~GHVP01004624.1.p1  ORF type:complete len:592 (+),score=106.92 GHVP01004624.1:227-1777(+)
MDSMMEISCQIEESKSSRSPDFYKSILSLSNIDLKTFIKVLEKFANFHIENPNSYKGFVSSFTSISEIFRKSDNIDHFKPLFYNVLSRLVEKDCYYDSMLMASKIKEVMLILDHDFYVILTRLFEKTFDYYYMSLAMLKLLEIESSKDLLNKTVFTILSINNIITKKQLLSLFDYDEITNIADLLSRIKEIPSEARTVISYLENTSPTMSGLQGTLSLIPDDNDALHIKIISHHYENSSDRSIDYYRSLIPKKTLLQFITSKRIDSIHNKILDLPNYKTDFYGDLISDSLSFSNKSIEELHRSLVSLSGFETKITYKTEMESINNIKLYKDSMNYKLESILQKRTERRDKMEQLEIERIEETVKKNREKDLKRRRDLQKKKETELLQRHQKELLEKESKALLKDQKKKAKTVNNPFVLLRKRNYLVRSIYLEEEKYIDAPSETTDSEAIFKDLSGILNEKDYWVQNWRNVIKENDTFIKSFIKEKEPKLPYLKERFSTLSDMINSFLMHQNHYRMH